MTTLEIAQQTYLSAWTLVRSASEEHLRARAELLAAKAANSADRIAIASFRSAYAAKLLAMRVREEHTALVSYEAALMEEVNRSRSEAEDPMMITGFRRCSSSAQMEWSL